MRNRKHDIEKYLRGELSPSEMYALEKEALSDPFLAEALEGIEHAGADNFLYDLHKLKGSVHDRMRRKTRKNSKIIRMWGWTSAVAATILLIAVSGFLVVQILKDQQGREEAGNAPSPDMKDAPASEDSLAVEPADSSLLAQKEAQKFAVEEPPRPAAPSAKGNEGRNVTPKKDANPSRQALADAQQPSEAESLPAVGEDSRDEDNLKKEDVSGAGPLARAEVAAKDTVIREVPSADKAVTEALEEKVAGVQTRARRAGETRAAAVASRAVKGKVRSEDGHGLPGVNVIIDGTDRGTVTDGEGNYALNVPDEATLVFTFIGFETQQILADRAELNVTLEEDISALSEVVVTGFGGDQSGDPSSFRFAEPDGGRIDFKSYLAGAVKYPQEAIRNKTEGKVTVRFTVDPSGKLTDFEVVKGIGSGCEEELIRAIQQGPYWKPSKRGEQPVKDKVRVRFKFNLPK